MQSIKRTQKAKVRRFRSAWAAATSQVPTILRLQPLFLALTHLQPWLRPLPHSGPGLVETCLAPDNKAAIAESWGTYSRSQRHPTTKMENEVSYPLEMCSYFDANEIKRLGKRFKKFDFGNSGSLSVEEFMSLPELQQKTLVRWIYRYIRHRQEWRSRLQRIL